MTYDALLSPYFGKLGKTLGKSFIRHCSGTIEACSASTHEIARHVSHQTGRSFNTAEKGLNYLLKNNNFQIDDRFWRLHIKMVFDMMKEQKLISEEESIYIQVDFTSSSDDFLILCASIIVGDRAVPLFFTMRNYPKRKGTYDHPKMEKAFIKELKHLLSKKYQYVIVADRGFGNERFINYCEDAGLNYVIRLQPSMRVQYGEHTGIMRNIITEDGSFDVFVPCWGRDIRVHRHTLNGKTWYIVSDIKGLNHFEIAEIYGGRFKIEKCFQDLKSSGFDIECSKIRKYDRYKRLLAMCVVAHTILVMVGKFVREHKPAFLKNFPLCGGKILVPFLSESALYNSLQKGRYLL